MWAGDWYRWWDGATAWLEGRLRAPALPHPARRRDVERERVHRRQTLSMVMWTVLLSGPFFASVLGGAVPVLAGVAQLSDRWYGLIQAMPALAMLAQLPGALLISRVRHRPRIVFTLGILARLIWIPVAAVPLLLPPGAVATASLLVMVGLAWVSFHISGLAWQSFMGDLVPARIRGVYFGTRLRLFSLTNLVSSVLLAAVLPSAQSPWAAWTIFGVFTVAAITGAIELLGYRHAYDTPRRRPAIRTAELLKPLADRAFLPFLVLGMLVAASNGIVGPFLWRHFLAAMEMPPLKVTLILQTSALLAMMLTAGVWGAWVDRYGAKAAMVVGIICGQAATLAWPVVSVERWWLGLAVMLVGVGFWTAVDVGLVNRLFRYGQSGGPGYFALFNGALAVAGFTATWLGGEIAERFASASWIDAVARWAEPYGLAFNVYMFLSLLCVGLRFVALGWLLRLVPRDKPHRTSDAVRRMALQMQAGAIAVLAWPWRRVLRPGPGPSARG